MATLIEKGFDLGNLFGDFNPLESIFGSALDSVGSALGARMQQGYTRSNADYAQELNRRSWEYQLLNGPALQVAGLRNAHLNPLLAVSNGLGSAGSIGPVSNQGGPAFQMLKSDAWFKGRMLSAELDKAQADAKTAKAVATSSAAKSAVEKLKADTELEALLDNDEEKGHVYVNGKEVEQEPTTLDRLRQMFRNQILGGEYQSSKGHKIFEDVLNSLGIVFNGVKAFKGGK